MKTILVPTDFSKNALNALKYAVKLADSAGAKLIVFHCSHQPANVLMEATTPSARELLIKEDIAEKKAALADHVGKAMKMIETGLKPKLLVESNPFVVENILEVSSKNRVSLIVMGTHGATGLEKVLFGSNTSELISKSDIPVLAIPDRFRFREIKKIVFATDLQDFTGELKRIMPFGKALDVPVEVLYMDYGPGITQDRLDKARKLVSRNGYERVKITVKPATIEIPLINQLNESVQAMRPGWLVMFTRERSFWDKIFHKSKTEKMAYDLKYPLLSFRKNA